MILRRDDGEGAVSELWRKVKLLEEKLGKRGVLISGEGGNKNVSGMFEVRLDGLEGDVLVDEGGMRVWEKGMAEVMRLERSMSLDQVGGFGEGWKRLAQVFGYCESLWNEGPVGGEEE